MDPDRRAVLHQVRELIELDQAFGVEFMQRQAPAPAPAASQAAAPAPAAARGQPLPARPAAVQAAPAPAPARSAVAVPPSAPPAAPSGLPAAAQALEPAAGDSLARISAEIKGCTACGLCTTRTTTVPGEGHEHPELLFIGEGPGAEEDAQGRPFVGPAGQLLTRMIEAMGLTREQVFIANVVKCRPPGNRAPEPPEVEACMGYLRRQVAVLRPKVICTLGNVPLRALFGAEQPGITRSRGQRLSWNGITVIPTFHPSYLLRTEQAKKPAWEDLQPVLRELGRTPPGRRSG